MKPAPFSIHIPDTIDEAVACLAEHGEEARVIAGGQSLMAMLNMRLAEPSILVDVSRLADLKTLEIGPDGLTVGAATTQAEVFHHPDLATHMPLVREALTHVGHIQTRNRGTVCGSLCHADPSAEMPLLLATLSRSWVHKHSAAAPTPRRLSGLVLEIRQCTLCNSLQLDDAAAQLVGRCRLRAFRDTLCEALRL